MARPTRIPNKKRIQINTRYYIVHLVKEQEFMFVRFYVEDYDKGQLNARTIRNNYIVPYLEKGWEFLDIETLTTTRSEYI